MTCAAVYRLTGNAGSPPSRLFSPMSHPPYQLLSKVLLGSALVMLLIGLYFLFAMGNTLVGGALIAVAFMDAGVAMVFSRKSS